MKKGLVFILGIITGIIITFAIAIIFASSNTDSENSVQNSPISWYEEPYETITFHNGVDVFQMLQDDYGLSNPSNYEDGSDVYLVRGDKIYDGKHIDKNSFVIKGVYRYKTRSNIVKNVPVIEAVN